MDFSFTFSTVYKNPRRVQAAGVTVGVASLRKLFSVVAVWGWT